MNVYCMLDANLSVVDVISDLGALILTIYLSRLAYLNSLKRSDV